MVLGREELDAVLAPLDRARPFPARVYLDDEVLAFERRALFDRAWICVGREEEVAVPGAWIRTPLGHDRIVVTRAEDLRLHAFFDVCRHRAATLLDGDAGACAQLVCPYHGWTYDLAGRLRAAPGAPPDFERSAHGLVRARVDAALGFVFVNVSGDAPPLRDALAPIPPWLARADLASLRIGRRTVAEAEANWKLLVENFQESHHFPFVHPGLERLTPASDSTSLFCDGAGDDPWLAGTMHLADGAETVSDDGLLHDRPFVAAPEDRARVHDAMLFPALLTSLQPDYLLTYRLWPLSPSRTRIVADVLFHPAAFRPGFAPDAVYAFWDRTNAEDRAICERQQIGLRSGGFVPSCWATTEDGTWAFDRLVARAYATALERDERGAR